MKLKPTSSEYKAFENVLGSVLKVTKAELNRRIEEEKRKPKARASHVSDDSSKPA
jgi:Mor family transcriptional regulator